MRASIGQARRAVNSASRVRGGMAAAVFLLPLLVGTAKACEPAKPVDVRLAFEPFPPVRTEAPGYGFTVRRVLALSARDADFGGFSGLLADRDGILLLSDRGTLWRTGFPAPGSAGPTAATFRKCRLRAPDPPLDAEDLARADGAIVVAAESGRGLYLLRDGTGVLEPARPPLPEWLRAREPNVGIEAAVGLTDGALLLFTEGAEAGPGALRAAVLRDGNFLPLRYPAEAGWAPVAAARWGEDLLVLERRFGLLSGFAARLRLVPAGETTRPDALLEPRTLVTLRPPFPTDNFEGLAVVPEADDRATLYLVSDDNFSPLQRTLLVIAALRRE